MISAVMAVLSLLLPLQQASAPMREDSGGRPVISVSVNGTTPLDFVVDTAAAQSVVMPRLVERMALEPDARTAEVQGASGRQGARVHSLRSLTSDAFELHDLRAVELPNGSATDAWGIVGMDGFRQLRVTFNHGDGVFAVGPSGPPQEGESVVPALIRGTFAIVEVRLDGVSVRAVVDSGAARSIANPAALAALGWQPDDARLGEARPVQGATSQRVAGRLGRVDALRLGNLTITNVPITFSDLPVFGALGLGDGPALILGSDVLGRLDSYAIDYPRRELQIHAPSAVSDRSGQRDDGGGVARYSGA